MRTIELWGTLGTLAAIAGSNAGLIAGKCRPCVATGGKEGGHMIFAAAALLYGGRTETLSLRPFLVMIAAALAYSYALGLLYARPLGLSTLLNAALYFGIGLVLFFLGHLAVNRFGRNRDLL